MTQGPCVYTGDYTGQAAGPVYPLIVEYAKGHGDRNEEGL